MQKTTLSFLPIAFLVQIIGATCLARAQAEKARYPAMAPLDLYLAPDENSEIALARSAAPASISDAAEVMVLGRAGYRTAVKGSNGFLCIVERSWGAATNDPDFWNPKVRAPICSGCLRSGFRSRPKIQSNPAWYIRSINSGSSARLMVIWV